MDDKTRKKLERLQCKMDKRYDALRFRLPYGLQWLTQSAELFDWYEARKKKILAKK